MIHRIHSGWQYPDTYLKFLYNIVLDLQPKKIVELGTRYGDTSIVMAQALIRLGNGGHINTYDLIEYEFISPNLALNNCTDIITFKQLSFLDWLSTPEDYDLLYIDVDNTPNKIQKMKP